MFVSKLTETWLLSLWGLGLLLGGLVVLLLLARRPLFKTPPAARPVRAWRPPQPGTPKLCPACRASHASWPDFWHALTRPAPPPWSQVKGRGGRPKSIDSRGVYCPNPDCPYFAIADPALHAIVADGHYGQDHSIQNWQCQACRHHASDRYGTFLYHLKKPPTLIANVLTALNDGQGLRAAARSHGVSKNTPLAGCLRLGQRAPALWNQFALGRVRVGAVQLDELHTIIKKREARLSPLEQLTHEVGTHWIWTACDPVHKLLLVAQLGPRTPDMACLVVHTLVSLLAPGCLPAFSSDGLRFYFTALTAHFGAWETSLPKPRWVVSPQLLYAQVIKKYARRKLASVTRVLLLGSRRAWQAALRLAGTFPSINTAFVARLNLTLRHSLAALTRRSLAISKSRAHLQLRLNAFLVYYNLVRIHTSLKTTPACSAGLTDHPWSWQELLSYRLPPLLLISAKLHN